LPGLLFAVIASAGGAIGAVAAGGSSEGSERTFNVVARQYGYEPAVIRVNRGDTVTLRFASRDVVHGFYLEGYDLDVTIHPMQTSVELRRPSQPDNMEKVEEIVFTADRAGKFRFRCSRTCGFMHPFMLGEFIVGPNRLLPASMGLAIGMLLGGLAYVKAGGRS
jgi:heme/copper-type cytochrome/quinol oxidase subunit 2